MMLLLLLLVTVITAPVDCDEFDEFDNKDVDDAVCDVFDVDIEVTPVPALTTLTFVNMTQVAAGDKTYPVVHFTHLKSLVNY